MISREEVIAMASEAGFVTDVWGGRQVVADDYGDYEITDDVMRLVAIAYNRGLTDRHCFVREVEDAAILKVVEIAREYIYYDSDNELFAKRINRDVLK